MKSKLSRAAFSLAVVMFSLTVEAQVIERGRFRVYDAKQVQGVESYEIRRAPGGLSVKAQFSLPFWGEERRPHLTAMFRARRDLTPLSFAVKGVDPSENDVNAAVRLRGDEQGAVFTLADISNVRKITSVVAAGRLCDPAALWQSVGFRP